MQLQTQTWEKALLSLAHEPLPARQVPGKLSVDSTVLAKAYRHCTEVTALHSRSFYLASSLLPPPKRQAVRALYAFCRVTDDIVDSGDQDAAARLYQWRYTILSANPGEIDPVALAWLDTYLRHDVPMRYIEQLIDGVGCDLKRVRYQTFEELTAYCYGVASTVGLMSMHIIGFAGPQAIPYAIKLGVALQVTNILRDVAEDWRADRLYLPQEELALFGLDEQDIAHGVAHGMVTQRWRAFMRYQIERNRQLYQAALPGVSFLARDGRLAIQAAAELYGAILQDIEANDYNVFARRAQIGLWGKLRRLPGIWWRSRQSAAEHQPVAALHNSP
jgi:15-cis-phytoene synthase